jgi:hypothetical protein
MNIIDPSELKHVLNQCYLRYNPMWGRQTVPDMEATAKAFKYYVEREAGLKLDYEIIVQHGQYGYKITQCEVVDEAQLLLFRLKWS